MGLRIQNFRGLGLRIQGLVQGLGFRGLGHRV